MKGSTEGMQTLPPLIPHYIIWHLVCTVYENELTSLMVRVIMQDDRLIISKTTIMVIVTDYLVVITITFTLLITAYSMDCWFLTWRWWWLPSCCQSS